ncbi:MAG: SIS domain-containing protein [Candidatus Aminicenantes bacterium]|nr:SIS domain-containing protein [Candidatus Aminicenantes bacterium]
MKYESVMEKLNMVFRNFLLKNERALSDAVEEISRRMDQGATLFIFGNGGSAAQSQHFAAELVNQFRLDRRPLPALALSTDTSVLTSIANDREYSDVFSRQISALARTGDVAVGLTTSGRSDNVISGLQAAREMGLYTLVLTGEGGGQMEESVDALLVVPSPDTARIQEIHLIVLHLMAEDIERRLASKELKGAAT